MLATQVQRRTRRRRSLEAPIDARSRTRFLPAAPVLGLVALALTAGAPAEAQESGGPPSSPPVAGPVSPDSAEAIRDTLERPPRNHAFRLDDVVALPFRVVSYPVKLVLRGVGRVAEWVALPGQDAAPVEAYYSLSSLGLRPGVVSDLGARSGPGLSLAFTGLSPLVLESAVTLRAYQRHRARLAFEPEPWGVDARVGWTRFTAEPYWGLGADAPADARVDYLQERWRADAAVSRRLGSTLVTVGGGWEETKVEPGLDDATPDLGGGNVGTAGFGTSRFVRARAALDHRSVDTAGAWPRGFEVGAGGQVHRGVQGTSVDFGTLEADAAVYLPVTTGQQIVLRGWSEVVRGGVGDVPFTHLPALGGGNTLRSYEWGRFRGRAAVAGTAEWRWKIWRNRYHGSSVHSFLFLDQGTVGAGLNDLGELRSSWGFGLGTHFRATRVSAYMAFGAEGSRLSASIRSEGW